MAQGLSSVRDFLHPENGVSRRFSGVRGRVPAFFTLGGRSASAACFLAVGPWEWRLPRGRMILLKTNAAPADGRRHGSQRQHVFLVERCRTAAGPEAAGSGAGADAGRGAGGGAGGAAGEGARRLRGAGDVAGAGGGGGVRARVGVAPAGAGAQSGAAGRVRLRPARLAASAGSDVGAGRGRPPSVVEIPSPRRNGCRRRRRSRASCRAWFAWRRRRGRYRRWRRRCGGG